MNNGASALLLPDEIYRLSRSEMFLFSYENSVLTHRFPYAIVVTAENLCLF